MKDIFVSAGLFLVFTGGIVAINCQRTIKVISAKEMSVEITIRKDNISGFARLAEVLPDGAEITYAKSEGGTYDIQNKKLKFIWLSLPQQEVFTVSYTVKTESLKEGNYAISGKFSYVEDNVTKEYEIPPTGFNIGANPTVNNGVPVSNSGSKVTYALQLLTSKDKLPADYFAKQYQVKEPVKVEVVNGLNKYVVGEFKSSAEALAYREELVKKGCKDAFVVAYLNNRRITPEEAKKLEGK